MEARGSAGDDCLAKLDLQKRCNLSRPKCGNVKTLKMYNTEIWTDAANVNRDQTPRLAPMNKMNKKLGVYPPSWKIRGGSGSVIHRSRIGKNEKDQRRASTSRACVSTANFALLALAHNDFPMGMTGLI